MTDSVATTAEDYSHDDDLWGHPKGLYVCFTTELWERFSFYGMKFLLVLYLTKYHLFTDEMGFAVLGAYAGLVYALPLIGGMLADRYLGMRKAVVFGGILLCLGHLLMAVEGAEATYFPAGYVFATDFTLHTGEVIAAGTVLAEKLTNRDVGALNVFYMALALIVMGVGYLKPNISTIVGKLYAKDDPRRDSGFTIFYMGINTGSFLAFLIAVWLGETFGWSYGFGAAGIGMVFGLISFLLGQKHLKGHAEPAEPEKLAKKVLGPINAEWTIYLTTIAALGAAWWLVQHEHIVLASQNIGLIIAVVGLILYSMIHTRQDQNNRLAFTFAGVAIVVGIYTVLVNLHILPGNEDIAEYFVYLAIALIVGFIIYGFRTHNSAEFGRTVALMILIVSTVVFWALFEQAGGSMTLYADRVVDREAFGITITAGQFGGANALFIVLLAIPFAMLWTWLAKKNLEPSTPVKFGLGIIQAGLGFGLLAFGSQFPDDAGKIAMIWLILAYLVHTTGELCLSPVGLSAVTKLSIGRVVGVSMGTWFLATALSETVAMRIGRIAAIDTSGGEVGDLATAVATYNELWMFLLYLGVGVGILMLLISPVLRRWMHGIH